MLVLKVNGENIHTIIYTYIHIHIHVYRESRLNIPELPESVSLASLACQLQEHHQLENTNFYITIKIL